MSNRRDGKANSSSQRPRSPSEALEPARAPSRPKAARRIRSESRFLGGVVRVVSGVLTTVLAVMVVLGGAGLFIYHQFEQPGPLESTRAVVVPKGGRIEIATRLEADGIIANRWTFLAAHLMQAANSERKNTDLKAGEYEIKKNASMHQVLEILMEGRSTVLNTVMIPPGFTSLQIVERLRNDQNLTGDIAEIPPEGSLLPDTYKISKGMTRGELLEHMRVKLHDRATALWTKRQPDLPFETLEQAIVLASIIQRETGSHDEQDKVAAVFVNRLRKNMPLQSDPTILYGLYGGAVQWGKPILRSEIDAKNTHNTYQIKGLPPTPICNPSIDAIKAALNPAQTRDLYFVADGQGGHTFTENLKDHNAAVKIWRQKEREIRARAAAAAAASGQPSAVPLPAAPDDEPEAEAAAPAPAAAPAAAPAPATAAATVPVPTRKPKKQ